MAMIVNVFGLRSVCLIAIAFCAILHLTFSDQKICGKAINDALVLMCGGKGYNNYKTKRNFPFEENFDNDEEETFGLDLYQLPFWTSMNANSLAKLRRRREGIYHECCLKQCSHQELLLYCNP
ncbi:probable insulin-like peptide 1 [Eupeodes corollae]|uniref:probable insulin-like peptide 1 n=1 Tax=Eupeodes corollae TaxID=290404 RepID=UPI00249299AD|nr:probable insulin-like peptide 1 [Eupeodes corollae]